MLNTADVCVNPDVANDMNDKSTMNKIMEYMALGKPIVQFDLTEGRVSAQDASLYARRNDPIDMARQLVALLDDARAAPPHGRRRPGASEDRAGLGARGAAIARGLRRAVQSEWQDAGRRREYDEIRGSRRRFRRNAGTRRSLRRALHRSAARAGRDRPQADPGDRPRAARAAGNLSRSAPLRLRRRRERRRHASAGDARIRDPRAGAAGDPAAGAAPPARDAAHGRQLDRDARSRRTRPKSAPRCASSSSTSSSSPIPAHS